MTSSKRRRAAWRAGLATAAGAALLGGSAWAQPPAMCPPGLACPPPPVIWGHYPTLWRRWPGLEEGTTAAELQPPAAVPGIDQELRTIVPERSDGSDLLNSPIPNPQDESLPQPVGQDAPPAPPVHLQPPVRMGRNEQAVGRRLRSITGQTRTPVQLVSLDQPTANRRAAADSREDAEDIWGDLAVDEGWRVAEGPVTRAPALPAASGNPLRPSHPTTAAADTGPVPSTRATAARPNPLR